MFRYKPAVASSEAGEGRASNAVDGVPTIVHEGRKCTETKQEKSPWWTVDLLTVQVQHFNTLQHSVTRCKLTNTHNYRLCWLGDRLDICFVRTLITCSLFSFYSHIIEIIRPGIIEYFLIWLATTTCTLVLVSPNQHITTQC